MQVAATRFWADCSSLRRGTSTCHRLQSSVGRRPLAASLSQNDILLLQASMHTVFSQPGHCAALTLLLVLQPDFTTVLVLPQPDRLLKCYNSRHLGSHAGIFGNYRLPGPCRFYPESSPGLVGGSQLALLLHDRAGELLLWAVDPGHIAARLSVEGPSDLTLGCVQWLPPSASPGLLCCTASWRDEAGTRRAQARVLDTQLQTCAESQLYEQTQPHEGFQLSPCGRLLCGLDGYHLIVLDIASCAAMDGPGAWKVDWPYMAGGDSSRVKLLWAPDSSAVLFALQRPEPELCCQQKAVVALSCQGSWQEQPAQGWQSGHVMYRAQTLVHAWAPQGLLCAPASRPHQPAQLAFWQGKLCDGVRNKLCDDVRTRDTEWSAGLDAPARTIRTGQRLGLVAEFSAGYTFLAVLTRQPAVGTWGVAVLRTRTGGLVQQWRGKPCALDTSFALKWAVSGAALLCVLTGEADSSTWVFEFDK